MNPRLPECNGLTDADMLALADRTLDGDAFERPAILLRAAYPSIEDVGALTLGRVNQLLLQLRRRCFGGTFQFVDKCPDCGEGVEFVLGETDFFPESTVPRDESTGHSLRHQGWRIEYHPIRLTDWTRARATASSGRDADPEAAARALLSACVEKARYKQKPKPLDAIPTEVWEALSHALNQADPWAEMCFNLVCPKCRKNWESFFEPVDYLLQEIESRARSVLSQIHTLASAYGWTEPTILALTPERRARYIRIIEESTESTPLWTARAAAR